MPDSVTTFDLVLFLSALAGALVTVGVLFRRFLAFPPDADATEERRSPDGSRIG